MELCKDCSKKLELLQYGEEISTINLDNFCGQCRAEIKYVIISHYHHPIVSDQVNSPDHYTSGGIETIAYLQAKLTPEEFRGYLKGNVLKYLSRSGKKDDEVEDLKKAQWYLGKLINILNVQSK